MSQVTVRPVLVVVAPISWMMTWWLTNGLPRQFWEMLACSVSATAAKQDFRPFTTEKRTAFLNTLSRGQPQRAPAKPLTVPSDVGAFGRRVALAPLIPRALVGI